MKHGHRLRIAITADPELPVPPRYYGGIERIIHLLVRGLHARGHEVTLFAHLDSTTNAQIIAYPGRSSRSLFDTVRNSTLITRNVYSGNYDILHSFSRLAYLLPLMPLGLPKLMTYQREITRRSIALAHTLSRGSLQFSAISRQMMAPVQDIGVWHLVYNGVPMEAFRFNASVAADAPLVFLGRIEHIKGTHLAIEIARRAGMPLVIAGNVPSEHQDYFDKNVKPWIDGSSVKYVGPVDDRQKNELLSQARALLMPILWEEPFGIVMGEALACGTPVVGLSRGSVPEVVEDGVTGFVRDSVDGLVEAVGKIKENQSRELSILRETKIQRRRRRAKLPEDISRVASHSSWSGLTAVSHRICLITPGHLATNPRIVKEADALSQAGFDVTVITGDYLDWAQKADKEFVGRPWRLDLKVAFGPTAPKLKYVAQTVRRRFARILVKYGFSLPAVIESAQHSISYDLIRAAKSVPADLYIAHYVAALPAAARAAAYYGAKFAFDAEDFHLGDFSDSAEFDFERMLVRAIEERYLRYCVYLTAASPGIAEAYSSTYGLPMPTVVLNVFPQSQAPEMPTSAGTTAPGPSVYWFSQTIGPDRGLETAVEALSLSSARPHLYVRGRHAKGFSVKLKALASKFGVSERVHFLDLAPPSEMERLASVYDIGLVSETGFTRNHKIALANKLFSFLLAGVPVVASAIPAHQQFFDSKDPVFLYEPTDAKGLGRTIDGLLLNRALLSKFRQLAWQLGQDQYNWDTEKNKFLAVVANTLESRFLAKFPHS